MGRLFIDTVITTIPIKQLVLLAGEPISKVLLHVRTEVEAKDWRCGTVSPSCFSRALYLLDMVVTFSSLSALDNSLDNGCFPKDFVDVRIWWFISPRALNSDRSTSLLHSNPTCYLHRSLAGSEFSRFLIGLIWFACAVRVEVKLSGCAPLTVRNTPHMCKVKGVQKYTVLGLFSLSTCER